MKSQLSCKVSASLISSKQLGDVYLSNPPFLLRLSIVIHRFLDVEFEAPARVVSRSDDIHTYCLLYSLVFVGTPLGVRNKVRFF